MSPTVAIVGEWRELGEFLYSRGIQVVDVAAADKKVDCMVVSRRHQAYLGLAEKGTLEALILAEGLSPEVIYLEILRRLKF